MTTEQRRRVLIAAAVAAVLGERARIVDIRPVKWVRMGRTAVQGSHTVKRQQKKRTRKK